MAAKCSLCGNGTPWTGRERAAAYLRYDKRSYIYVCRDCSRVGNPYLEAHRKAENAAWKVDRTVEAAERRGDADLPDWRKEQAASLLPLVPTELVQDVEQKVQAVREAACKLVTARVALKAAAEKVHDLDALRRKAFEAEGSLPTLAEAKDYYQARQAQNPRVEQKIQV